jgi:TonB family protein
VPSRTRTTVAVSATLLAVALAAGGYGAFRVFTDAGSVGAIQVRKPNLKSPGYPVTTYVSCDSLGAATSRIVGPGSVSELQIVPGCALSESFYFDMVASAADFAAMKNAPEVAFDITTNGNVAHVSLLRSSGNSHLDEQAMQLIRSRRYHTERCGRCKVQTTVNVDWEPDQPR